MIIRMNTCFVEPLSCISIKLNFYMCHYFYFLCFEPDTMSSIRKIMHALSMEVFIV